MNNHDAQPLVFMDGQDPDGREMWIAWIDYMAQGQNEEEARRNFAVGWSKTLEVNREAGITPGQMIEARYPDYAGEIARLNARIEKMDAERIEMIDSLNFLLDKLRDAIAERA